MKPSNIAFLAGLLASAAISMSVAGTTVAWAATPPKPAITEDASSAIARMGATLRAKEFSFQVRTIRVSANNNGELQHIEHAFKVTVVRPDRLLIDGTGDDGPRKLVYDGKAAAVVLENGKKYHEPFRAEHDRRHDARPYRPFWRRLSARGFPHGSSR